MCLRRLRVGCAVVVLLAGSLAWLPAPAWALLPRGTQAQAARAADFQKLLADKTPAIVTIKFVLKTEARWGDSDEEREATGVIIEPDGLVLCSKTTLGDYGSYYGGSRAIPTDIKVLIGDDTEGIDAKLIARDSELDLTWLRIEAADKDQKFPYVDLRQSARPSIGERFYCVSRMGKYFGHVGIVSEGRIGGLTRKPRRLYVPSNGQGDLGLPVYDADGKVIGVPIRQRPEREELEGAGSFYGAWGLILPVEEVINATQRAKEVASADESEETDRSP
jgi:S1-C subfamily serine protease